MEGGHGTDCAAEMKVVSDVNLSAFPQVMLRLQAADFNRASGLKNKATRRRVPRRSFCVNSSYPLIDWVPPVLGPAERRHQRIHTCDSSRENDGAH